MRTFTFAHKHSSAVVILSATDYVHARIEFTLIIKYGGDWRCDNEEGDPED